MVSVGHPFGLGYGQLEFRLNPPLKAIDRCQATGRTFRSVPERQRRAATNARDRSAGCDPRSVVRRLPTAHELVHGPGRLAGAGTPATTEKTSQNQRRYGPQRLKRAAARRRLRPRWVGDSLSSIPTSAWLSPLACRLHYRLSWYASAPSAVPREGFRGPGLPVPPALRQEPD